jgi:nucleoside 2-deoxyribosyltransferase
MKHVYLAGPIGGRTQEEAKGWREDVSAQIKGHGIAGISPLRCEPGMSVDNVYDRQGYVDPSFGTADAIGSKNEFDVRSCHVVLAYMPFPSHGTDIEIGMARALNKPIILVTEDPDIRGHAVRNYVCNWILTDLDEAVDLIIGLLGDYK